VIFDVIVFPIATFVLFRGLSHKNAWISHTLPCRFVWVCFIATTV